MTRSAPRNPRKDFSQKWKGSHSGVHEAGTAVARTQEEWQQLWRATHSIIIPPPKAPRLPEDKIAIGIFTGQSSQPGEISVTNIAEQNGKLVIEWKAAGQRSMLCVMHDPFLLKFIDKTDKAVEFRKEQPSAPKIDLKKLKRIGNQPK